MTENNSPLQNTPIDPRATANQSQATAQDVQQQFIPQVDASEPIHDASKIHHTKETNLDRFLTKYIRYVQKTVVWGLMAQGLFNIYKSISFILVELPGLETQQGENIITQDDVNGFASKAVMLTISAIITMIFAMKLSAVQNKTAKRVRTAIGIGLMLANTWITSFLNSQQSGQIIGDFAFSLLQMFR